MVVPIVIGSLVIAPWAASGVSPAIDGIVYRSGPLEIINLTLPPASTFPPPGGTDSIICPLAISSSNLFSSTTAVNPRGVNEATASLKLPPTVEGTTTREPGPTNVHQPPMPRAIAKIKATLRFLRTRALARFFFSSFRFNSRVVSLTSTVSSLIGSSFIFLRAFSRIGSTGRSSPRSNWLFLGSNSI